jgi:hypothetical protein
MTKYSSFEPEKSATPFCQATGCFEKAYVYLVVTETEEPDYYEVAKGSEGMAAMKLTTDPPTENSQLTFDGFKIILYLCPKHDDEFKYLIRGSELMISKTCFLIAPKIHNRANHSY